jgi:2-haloacid dehalogenase
MFKLLSFDVYGTLMDTPATNTKAFRVILKEAGAPNIDPQAFYQFWEARNIVHYREPYRSYKEIGRLSLEEAFEHFGLVGGNGDLVDRYFSMFSEMQLYPDVLPTLEQLAVAHRLALVSNIDDDLLRATRLHRDFDVVCTAERARGYKPDGTLFRYLIANAGVGLGEILHSGQSQHTDLVGGKALGLTVAWINRRNLTLHPTVPPPDFMSHRWLRLLTATRHAEPDPRWTATLTTFAGLLLGCS